MKCPRHANPMDRHPLTVTPGCGECDAVTNLKALSNLIARVKAQLTTPWTVSPG